MSEEDSATLKQIRHLQGGQRFHHHVGMSLARPKYYYFRQA